MTESRPRYRVDVLALPEVTASTLFGVYDLLAGAGRDWDFIVNGTLGEGAFAARIVTADGASFRASNGVRIEPDAALGDAERPDLICIPDMFVAPGESIEGRYAAETA